MGDLAMIRRNSVLAGCIAALTLAACATTPEAPPVDKTPPMDTQETTARPTEAAETQVTGSVFYLERIALSPQAVVQVEVVELALAGGQESLLGERTLSSPGQVPISFSVGVPQERIRPEGSYVVRARITDGGRTFTTPEPVPVLTQGHPSQDVRVRVRIGG
jgi:putative lipoprotein